MLRAATIYFLAVAVFGAQPDAARPFPQHAVYAPGTILPNHRTQQQLDDDVRAFYDEWKADYLKPAGKSVKGHPTYRVIFGKKKKTQTVSEGQGYGMVMTALMAGHDPNAQALFDGLFDFAMLNPSKIEPRLMAWKVPNKGGNDSAFDGDADIAYGLLLADKQWGSAGQINYAAAARERLAGILGATIGPQSHLPMLGDWVQADGKGFNQFTVRSSDFMPGHFRAYGRFTNDAVWQDVVAKTQGLISSLQFGGNASGLLPDFIVMSGAKPAPAPPNFLEGPNDGGYSYNAGRDPWRIGADAVVNGDETSRAQAALMARFFRKASNDKPDAIRAGYTFEGKPLKDSNYFTSFFVAPAGVAAMVDAANQNWLNAVYDSVRTHHEDYYEDSVTLQCLLVMTGNFFDPTK